jgi:NAD(P)-dependent dehydrogenase (short-subunit alcohol dehydrogenase family)
MVRRSILITGGLGDIGFAIARGFAEEGAQLSLVDIRADEGAMAAELMAAGAESVRMIVADVADETAAAAVMQQVFEEHGKLDVLVNVAGAMIYKPIADLDAADWHRLLGVNFVGAALLTGQALRRMGAGGVVINIGSVHARRTSPLVAPYAAAKAALVSLTRSAAIEGKPLGIRVNAILPGAIDTAMLRDSPNIKSGAEVIDPADLGTPRDVADLTRFLASDAARFITGEDVVADGGRMGRL